MKQFIKETWRDLKYLAICIVCGIVYIFDRFWRQTTPREQGFLGGIFFCAVVIFSLAVLAEPPMPPTP